MKPAPRFKIRKMKSETRGFAGQWVVADSERPHFRKHFHTFEHAIGFASFLVWQSRRA